MSGTASVVTTLLVLAMVLVAGIFIAKFTGSGIAVAVTIPCALNVLPALGVPYRLPAAGFVQAIAGVFAGSPPVTSEDAEEPPDSAASARPSKNRVA